MCDYDYINQCIEKVPEHVNFIYDIDTNPYYFEDFHKDIYETIGRLPWYFQEQMNKTNNPINTIGNADTFFTFKILQGEIVEIVGQSNYVYDESLPFHFNLVDDGLLCDFIDATSLEEKLIASKKRYMSFDVNFISKLKNHGHSVCVCFDKFNKTCFLIDSNGSLSYFDNPDFGFSNYKQLVHFSMEFYCGLLGYEYIKLLNSNINISFNYKINSIYQKSFFNGYCKGWTLFFQMVATSAPDKFELTDWLRNFSKTNPAFANKIIEIFQVWFYWTYKISDSYQKKLLKTIKI
jgi:hypothetical protein